MVQQKQKIMTLDEAIKLKLKDKVWIFDELHMKIEEVFVLKVFIETHQSIPIENLNSTINIKMDRYHDESNSYTIIKKLHQVFKTKEELLKQITN